MSKGPTVDPYHEVRCRFCQERLKDTVVDLGMSPLCESYISADKLNHMEPFYPLHVYVCSNCWLVQLEQYVSAEEIFSEYAYFSSFSDTFVKHARDYTEKMIARFGLNKESQVVEIASNDGYLLQWFVQAGIPVLGIEPAGNVATAAEKKGVHTLVRFFGSEFAQQLASEGRSADLLLGNNVLAQVPDLIDFIAGLKIILASRGVLTMEFPHVMRLIQYNQFDTIYHEHFGYFSLHAVKSMFESEGLELFDVEEIPVHGGSLRIYARHSEDESKVIEPSVADLLASERSFGLTNIERYHQFTAQVEETKRGILELLIRLKRSGKRIVGYGAPGKGNTFLNFCGIRTDFLDFTVDRNSYKQGKFLPGTHIPIYEPEEIFRIKPDYVFILPWNFKEEIMKQLNGIREWGGQFVIAIPEPDVLP
jgi:hypothetical protein